MKPTMEQAIAAQLSRKFLGLSCWCRDGNIESYPRIERPGVLSITNLHSIRPYRNRNVYSRTRYIRTGDFDIWLAELERVARLFGFTEVYFGGVCNEFLPDVLTRKGYVRVMDQNHLLPHYAKFFPTDCKIPA